MAKPIVEIELTQGYVAIVDPVDMDLMDLSWSISSSKRYAQRMVFRDGRRSTCLLHRMILERKLGRSLSSNEHVDHINRNGLDNQRSNLRLASRSENAQNSKLRSTNTSGYTGVHKFEQNGHWRSQIYKDGADIKLGSFATEIDAAIAYNHAALRLFGSHAKFNNIADWENINPKPIAIGKPNPILKGVTPHRGRWRAQIVVRRKHISLGTFDTPEAAHEAYCKAASELRTDGS